MRFGVRVCACVRGACMFACVCVCVSTSTSEPIHRFPQEWFERLRLGTIQRAKSMELIKRAARRRFMSLYIYVS